MDETSPPKLKKFPAAKQRRLDQLLERNATGTITSAELRKLESLVAEAEELMVDNGQRLADFARRQAPLSPVNAVPVTVWVNPQASER